MASALRAKHCSGSWTEEPGAEGEGAPWGAHPTPLSRAGGLFYSGAGRALSSPLTDTDASTDSPGELTTAPENTLPRKTHAASHSVPVTAAEAHGGAGRGSGSLELPRAKVLQSSGDQVKTLAPTTDVTSAEE